MTNFLKIAMICLSIGRCIAKMTLFHVLTYQVVGGVFAAYMKVVKHNNHVDYLKQFVNNVEELCSQFRFTYQSSAEAFTYSSQEWQMVEWGFYLRLRIDILIPH